LGALRCDLDLNHDLNLYLNIDHMRRKLEDKNVRKIFRSGRSYVITLPIELLDELKWRNRQKLVVKKYGKGLLIRDWS